MAKPHGTKASAGGATKPGKHTQHKNNAGGATATPVKNGAKTPTQGKPKHDANKSTTGAPGAATATASPEVTVLLTRMSEKGLTWYQSLKPLKIVETPSLPTSKKNKKNHPKPTAEELLKASDERNKLHSLSEFEVQGKKRHAQQLLEQELARFESKKSGKLSSDDKYLATMMSKGTLADRVAALTLTIQSSPFHSLHRVSQLIQMASKKARRESMMAVESLKDLFVNNLLPDDRKLLFFHQHPLDHADVNDGHLVVWFYEHCLKTAFAQLVGVLSSGMQDAVDNHKRACIRAANALLAAKPEQEAVLLGMLVNKIGDPDRKIAAYIHKTLQELLTQHPLMKRVVVDEVERLLTRAQVSDRTKYNAVLFLNQMMLRKDDEDDAVLAAHLIKVFFALFSKEVHGAEEAEKKRSLKAQHKASKKAAKHGNGKRSSSGAIGEEGGSMDRKLLSALLMGVNRAFPYAKTSTSADLHEEIDTLFKVVRMATHFPTSVHAMMLLFQVMHATHSVSDRFYTALYEKLFDPKLRETSKHTLFLNLVFKALKADVSPARSSSFVKRLLQLTSVMTPAFTCAVLFLLSEVVKIKPHLRTLLDQPEAGGAAAAAVATEEATEERNVFNPEEEQEDDDEDDDDEDKEEDKDEETATDGLTDSERTAKVLAEMFGSSSSSAAEPEKPRAATSFDDESSAPLVKKKSGGEEGGEDEGSSYDWHKRNPLFAGAETSCAWEIHHLLVHYHPSVQMFARQLVTQPTKGISYAGDPLVDFTLHAFFEKFMNKKPRHKQTQTQTQRSEDGSGAGAAKSWTFAAINSEALLEEAPEDVDASDQFFYKFFKERAERDAANPQRSTKKKTKKTKDERMGDVFSDEEGGEDDEEDAELEAFTQKLAESIMVDGDMDEEDPELDEWSGPEDDDDDEEEGEEEDGGELDDEEEDEVMAFGGDGEEEEEDSEMEDDDDDEEEEDDEEDDDDEDGFDFSAMDGDLDLPKVAKQKAPPSAKGQNKKKSMFADADDYEQILRDAMAKQKQQIGGGGKRKGSGADAKSSSKKQRKH